jgi:integrase/recombinase XerD
MVNQFDVRYRALGFGGRSSHSGRRGSSPTPRKISVVGGSLRDVHLLAGHASLSTTQRYIERMPTRNGGSLSF